MEIQDSEHLAPLHRPASEEIAERLLLTDGTDVDVRKGPGFFCIW